MLLYKIEFTVKGQVLSLNLCANGILKGPSGSKRSALKLVPESDDDDDNNNSNEREC